jgi:hypothetical protein
MSKAQRPPPTLELHAGRIHEAKIVKHRRWALDIGPWTLDILGSLPKQNPDTPAFQIGGNDVEFVVAV